MVLWRGRATVLWYSGLVGLIGMFFAYSTTAEYSASTRLLPYKNNTAGAGLSGLAGLAGIRLPVAVTDQTITAELYPEVAKSIDYKLSVAESPLYFRSLGRKASFIEFNDKILKPSLIKKIRSNTIGLPGKLFSKLRASSTETATAGPIDSLLVPVISQKYLNIAEMVGNRVSVSMDRRTSIITINAKMPDPYAAADLVRISSERLVEKITAYESQKANENYKYIADQHTQAKIRYERAQRDLAIYVDRNRLLMSATSQLDRDRLQRETDLAFELYQQFSRELEQARIRMNQETPVFTVLEREIVPTSPTSPKRGAAMLLSIILGTMLGIGRITIAPVIIKSLNQDSQ